MADYETIRIDEQPADDDGGETSALSQAEVEERKLAKLLEGHFPWHSHIDSRTYQLLDMGGKTAVMYMNLQCHEEEKQILKKKRRHF